MAALSLVRAAGGASLGARALELAVAAVDTDDGRGNAAGGLRLLIAEAKKALKGSAMPPAWVYARAMRAALREEAGAGAAEAVSLLYEEALSEGGDKDKGGEMALHEAALTAHAAEGQWCVHACVVCYCVVSVMSGMIELDWRHPSTKWPSFNVHGFCAPTYRNPALAVLERMRTSGQTPSAACFNHAVHGACFGLKLQQQQRFLFPYARMTMACNTSRSFTHCPLRAQLAASRGSGSAAQACSGGWRRRGWRHRRGRTWGCCRRWARCVAMLLRLFSSVLSCAFAQSCACGLGSDRLHMIAHAHGQAGRWEGALQLLDHVQGMQQQQQQGERQSRLRVTPAMVKAAAAICVRAGKVRKGRAQESIDDGCLSVHPSLLVPYTSYIALDTTWCPPCLPV